MTDMVLINTHAVIPASMVNGPGNRMVVFFQGCDRRCPGCFNPATHPLDVRCLYTPEEIFHRYFIEGIEGITVSGGEPFLQPEALYELLKAAKGRGLTTVVYTGFDYEDVSSDGPKRRVFDFTDVMVDGRFDIGRKEPTLLARGSTNQRLHFLNSIYRESDFLMPGKVEVIIGKDGRVMETGFGRAVPYLS
ncbi:MAG: radical SAM protein [Deltaproteobacteria bacterium]|nr:radical SAM protein [Deltaproteobacteria bacterium]